MSHDPIVLHSLSTTPAAAGCRAQVGNLQKAKTPPRKLSGVFVLATSYSRTTYRRTTIGAAAFHFRVRNGNGWCHCAKITRGTRIFEWRFSNFDFRKSPIVSTQSLVTTSEI